MTRPTQTFGDRLKWAIAQASFKQASYARELGITAVYMNAFCGNRKLPGRDLLVQMAKDLSVSVDWLLAGQGAADSQHAADVPVAYSGGTPKELQELWARLAKNDRDALMRCGRLLDAGAFDVHDHIVRQLEILERVKPAPRPKSPRPLKRALGD